MRDRKGAGDGDTVPAKTTGSSGRAALDRQRHRNRQRLGVRNWRSVDSGIDNGIGVNAGVRIWRSIGFVIDINVSIGRDAGVGADDGCDWIGCDECGAGVRSWRGAGRGTGAECVAAGLMRRRSGRLRRRWRLRGRLSVSVAVVEHGKMTYAKAFGKAALEPARAADANTRYAMGSISKQFTVAAILLAAEQGKLSLDDKVSKYFPDFTRANEITLRQLLSHTSGYEDYAPQDYIIPEWTKPTTPEDLLNEVGQEAARFRSGHAVAVQQHELCAGRKNFREGYRRAAGAVPA